MPFVFPSQLPWQTPPSSTQEALKKKYQHIQNWIEWVGQEAVAALRNMEANYQVTENTLLELRAVATPQCAKAVLPTMLKEKVSRKEVDAAIASAVHDQFVDWCWCAENPNIHPSKGVSSFLRRSSPERKQWEVTIKAVLCENAHNLFMRTSA